MNIRGPHASTLDNQPKNILTARKNVRTVLLLEGYIASDIISTNAQTHKRTHLCARFRGGDGGRQRAQDDVTHCGGRRASCENEGNKDLVLKENEERGERD